MKKTLWCIGEIRERRDVTPISGQVDGLIDFSGEAGRPRNSRVPHSIAFCAIEWGSGTARDQTEFHVAPATSGLPSPQA